MYFSVCVGQYLNLVIVKKVLPKKNLEGCYSLKHLI